MVIQRNKVCLHEKLLSSTSSTMPNDGVFRYIHKLKCLYMSPCVRNLCMCVYVCVSCICACVCVVVVDVCMCMYVCVFTLSSSTIFKSKGTCNAELKIIFCISK